MGTRVDGNDVRVAHLDTGVDATHPALAAAVGAFAEIDFSGREKPGATAWESDRIYRHGTHTAATIAARPVDGRHVGVAPGRDCLSAMVIEGGEVVARILGGMDWALGQNVRVRVDVARRPGHPRCVPAVIDILPLPGDAAGHRRRQRGAGNEPLAGQLPKALSVGAHDEHGAVADFSSSQRFRAGRQPLVPDVVGPGRRRRLGAPMAGAATALSAGRRWRRPTSPASPRSCCRRGPT